MRLRHRQCESRLWHQHPSGPGYSVWWSWVPCYLDHKHSGLHEAHNGTVWTDAEADVFYSAVDR